MPVYEYECSCAARVTAYRKIAVRDICPHCEVCGGDTRRVVSRANINPDIFDGYLDPNLQSMHSNGQGTYIKSRQHRKEVMRQLGVVEAG